ncbi:MAG: hypothetical protein QG580_279 [Patescibacteria group bacterium]|jgi:hypothetical protein|nr:hypothetical protein [Patescibacteria group bacterium]
MKHRIRRPVQRKVKKKTSSEKVGALNKKQREKRNKKFKQEMLKFLKEEGLGYGQIITPSNN